MSGPISEAVFTVHDSDAPPDARAIHEGLQAHVESQVGASQRQAFTILARELKSGVVLGGAQGFSHWSWLYISHLWVSRESRAQGLGAKLIQQAEVAARSRACIGVYVDTFDVRALGFYQKHGYQEAGRIPDFPPGHARYFLFKQLQNESSR